MKRLYFGTDGVRGPFGGPLINPEFAARLGQAAARWAGGSGRVIIGRDNRISGPVLQEAIAAGLSAGGLTPVSLGVVPSPAVARAVRHSDAILGVMLTASHNPASDNGIKFFTTKGIKLTDADETAIEGLLPDAALWSEGMVLPEVTSDYVESMSHLLPAKSLQGWRVVLDTAHGATCATSPLVLKAFGAEVIGVGAESDGARINDGVGSEHPGLLSAQVLAHGAHLGIAHDGDGDRCVLCDELGVVLDGDELLTVLAGHALDQGRLANNTLVVTVQSNLGVDRAVRQAGGRTLRTLVGDRYVIERMMVEGASLGGESSGHVICADVAPTGDGLVAALRILEVMIATGKPLSELRRRLVKFPQGVRNLVVREKQPLQQLTTLIAEMAALESELGDTGRVLVRFSGTEPMLRLLVEGQSSDLVNVGLDRLETAARCDLEVI